MKKGFFIRNQTYFIARVVSFLFVISIFLQGIPLNAFAAERTPEPVHTIGEIEFLRESDSETYLLSDGTYERVIYGTVSIPTVTDVGRTRKELPLCLQSTITVMTFMILRPPM